MRFLVTWWRRWRVRHDLYAEQPDRHPALATVQVGEFLPWKGTHWRVSMIREQPVPCLVLVPVGETRASLVGRVTELRRDDRLLTAAERQARGAAVRQALAGERRVR